MTVQQKERHFIIGLVYGINEKGKEVIEAVQLYNPVTHQSKIESLNNIKKRIRDGQQIVGARIKDIKRFSEKEESFVLNEIVVLNKTVYNHTKLSKLNGKGEVLEKGKEVVVGTKKIDDQLKFIIINNSLETQYLDKEEVVKERYVGVIRDVIGKPSQIEIE